MNPATCVNANKTGFKKLDLSLSLSLSLSYSFQFKKLLIKNDRAFAQLRSLSSTLLILPFISRRSIKGKTKAPPSWDQILSQDRNELFYMCGDTTITGDGH